MCESFGHRRVVTLCALVLFGILQASRPSTVEAQRVEVASDAEAPTLAKTLPAAEATVVSLTEALEALLEAPEAEMVKGALSHAAQALDAARKAEVQNDSERARRARALAATALSLAERQMAVIRERALLRAVTLRLEKGRAALRAHRASRRALEARKTSLMETLAHPPAPESPTPTEPEGAEN